MAEAAAATAAGGAAMYPTVVGETGGLKEEGKECWIAPAGKAIEGWQQST